MFDYVATGSNYHSDMKEWKRKLTPSHEDGNLVIRVHNIDGGPGSGNWGHEGVVGQLGGSAPGGGRRNRQGDKYSGYTSQAKQAQQEARQYRAIKKILKNPVSSEQMTQTVDDIRKEIKANGGKVTMDHIKRAGEAVNGRLLTKLDEESDFASFVANSYETLNSKEMAKKQQILKDEKKERDLITSVRRGLRTKEEAGFSSEDEFNEYQERYKITKAAADVVSRQIQDMRNDYEAYKNCLKATMEMDAEEKITVILSSVRDVGCKKLGDIKTAIAGNSKQKDTLEDVLDHMPTSWSAKLASDGMTLRDMGDDFRSCYAYGGEIRLSNAEEKQYIYHETGHMIEEMIPGVHQKVLEFYQARTKNEKAVQLGEEYEKSEVTKKDSFVNKYIGKDYGGVATEVLSMGIQYAYNKPYTMLEDTDMSNLIYGILAIM